MMPTRINEVVRYLRKTALRQDEAGLTDRHLLSRFVENREEAAVAALIRRHGPMVWGVCLRVLRNHHDSEDAIQATFLVLVRKAGSVRPREMVGNWLYGVAHQTAVKARAMRTKRRTRESQVTNMPESETPPEGESRELQALLDQELSRLPDKYRAAIVLCDLEGQTRKEAARQLGVPEGTLAGRLRRGKAILARRLTRHGPVLSGATLAAARVPPMILSSTIKAATIVAAGQPVVAGAISANVAALTQGVLKAMLLTKLKAAAVLSLFLCILGTGLGAHILAGQTLTTDGQQQTEKRVGEAAPPLAAGDAAQEADKPEIIKRRVRDLERKNQLLTRELESLRKELKPGAAPAPSSNEVRLFNLPSIYQKNVEVGMEAPEVAKVLDQLFNTNGQEKKVHIAAFTSTNTIIVRGGPADIEAIAAMIARLERNTIEHRKTLRPDLLATPFTNSPK